MSTIEEILASADQKEIVVAIDSVKRSDYSAKTWYYTTHFRETGASETPANTPFPQYLLGGSVGPLSQALSEDLFSGLATVQPGSLRIIQTVTDADDLSQLHDYIFAGQQVRIYIGLQSSATFTSTTFPVFATLTIQVDPSIASVAGGVEAVFPLQSATARFLKESLQTKRYVGIPTGLSLLTATGRASAPHIAAYNLLSYCVGLRFKIAAAQTWNQVLTEKNLSGTNRNWNIHIGSTTSGYSGKIRFNASFGGTNVTIATSPLSYVDGQWHSLVAGLLDKTTAFLMIDNEILGTYTPTVSVDVQTAVVAVGVAGFSAIGKIVQVCVSQYMAPDVARIVFANRIDSADARVIGLWRFDDNAGAAGNDYSATNNDMAITGTAGVDWNWDYTDLGEPELAGRPYPLTVGEVFNAQAQLIDSRERYRGNVDTVGWHTSGSNTSLVVKSRGTILTGGGTDYTAPSNGGDGVFSTTSQEDEPITFDLTNNGTAESEFYLSQVVSNLLTERTGIVLSSNSIDQLRVLCPWKAGYRAEEDRSAGQALQELLGDSGLSYREDAAPLFSGQLYVDLLLPPIGYGPYGEPMLDLRGSNDNGYTFGDVGDITGSCTICGWFETALVDQTAFDFGSSEPNVGTAYVCAKSDTAGNYALYFQSIGSNAGTIAFRIAGTTLHSPAGLVQSHHRYFIAGVFDDTANTMSIYLGDAEAEPSGPPFSVAPILVATATNAGTPTANASALAIGGQGHAWCALQHIQVYNTVKTAANLLTLMSTPPVGNEADLKAYVPCNERAGLPKEMVSGVTGTQTGSLASLGGHAPQWAPRLEVDLGTTPSVTLSDFHRVDPASEVIVQHSRNWHPMTAAEIDTGVSQNAALDLKREWKDVSATFPEIADNYEQHKKVILPSALTTQKGAEKLFSVIADRFSEDRWIGKLTFPPGLAVSALACALKIGDEIGIKAEIPFQLQESRSFRIIAVAPDLLSLSTTVVFWG